MWCECDNGGIFYLVLGGGSGKTRVFGEKLIGLGMNLSLLGMWVWVSYILWVGFFYFYGDNNLYFLVLLFGLDEISYGER